MYVIIIGTHNVLIELVVHVKLAQSAIRKRSMGLYGEQNRFRIGYGEFF